MIVSQAATGSTRCMEAFPGNDKLYGEHGDDYLHGGDGFDELYGGGHVDECVEGEILDSCEYVAGVNGVLSFLEKQRADWYHSWFTSRMAAFAER